MTQKASCSSPGSNLEEAPVVKLNQCDPTTTQPANWTHACDYTHFLFSIPLWPNLIFDHQNTSVCVQHGFFFPSPALALKRYSFDFDFLPCTFLDQFHSDLTACFCNYQSRVQRHQKPELFISTSALIKEKSFSSFFSLICILANLSSSPRS